jgi:hypothetical protein
MDGIINETQPVQISSDLLETRVLRMLDEKGVIDLDVLIQMLPEYSWNQIFHSVDQLARIKKIVLRRDHYKYTLFGQGPSGPDLQDVVAA